MLTRIIAVTDFSAPGIHSKFKRRLEHVKNTLIPSLRAIGLEPEIFPAIIGSKCSLTEGAIGWRGVRIKLGSGCVGNLLSNYELWRLSAETNQAVMILEDDAVLPERNAQDVLRAIKSFSALPEGPNILYLLGQNPSLKNRLKSYHPSEVSPIDKHIHRLIRTADLSCTAAYVVTPAAARRLMERIDKAPTIPTDGFVHTALRSGVLGVVVQAHPEQGFMLNDNWAEWNHKHEPELLK